MCWRGKRSSPTTPRWQCWRRALARPKPPAFGPTAAMNARGAAPSRPRALPRAIVLEPVANNFALLGPMADHGSISVLVRPQRRTSEGSSVWIQRLDARRWLCRVRRPLPIRHYPRGRLHGPCPAQVRPRAQGPRAPPSPTRPSDRSPSFTRSRKWRGACHPTSAPRSGMPKPAQSSTVWRLG